MEREALLLPAAAPMRLTPEEIRSARRVIIFDELPDDLAAVGGPVERWELPPVTLEWEKARDLLRAKSNELPDHLAK